MLLQRKTYKYWQNTQNEMKNENEKNENLMEEINGKPGDFSKRFIKIKLDSDDDLPLGKLPKLHNLTIIVRSIFQEDKHYPQFF